MMRNAEKYHSLAPEQYGSHKNHRAIDLAANKMLAFDILSQTKPQEHYALMVHNLAMISLYICQPLWQCRGRESLKDVLHVCLLHYKRQHTMYKLHLGIIPFHGICQGNGADPPIWAVVSTLVLNMLRQANVGSFLHMLVVSYTHQSIDHP
jgi:hypothetical protein